MGIELQKKEPGSHEPPPTFHYGGQDFVTVTKLTMIVEDNKFFVLTFLLSVTVWTVTPRLRGRSVERLNAVYIFDNA